MANVLNLFKEFINSDNGYRKSLQVVRDNSSWRVWLFGGAVYKNLAHILYGSLVSKKDYDFLVDSLNYPLTLPKGFQEVRNRFGNLKIKGPVEIDVVLLRQVYWIDTGSPNIDGFLEGELH